MIESVQKGLPAELVESAGSWEEAYNRGDAAALGALYAEQASWCGSQTGVLTGRAAIRAAMQKFMEAGLKSVKVSLTEAKWLGDEGYMVTRYQFFGSSGQLLQSGNALSLVARQGGKLEAHHHWAVGDPQPK